MANAKTASFVTITDLNDSVPLIRGTQAAITGAWTGVAPFRSLENGQQISYLLPFNGSGDATLNLTLDGGGTTGAIACYYGGTSRLTTHYGAGNIIRLTYIVNNLIAGANYTGWWADANYTDGDTYDRTRVSGATKAGTGGVAASRFVVADDTGYRNLAVGSVFDITKPILWTTTAVAAGASSSSAFYSVYPTCSIAQGQTTPAQTNLTIDKIAYIKGTMSGNWFTVTGAPIFTDVVPTTEDGFIYYSVGRMSTATNCLLGFDHGLYYYKNGAFTQYTPMANEAFDKATDKSAIIFAAEYADRETLLPLDAGALVFFSNQKQTYRYEGYIEGVHEWSNVTYELVGPLAQELSNLQGQLGTRTTVFTRSTAPTIGEGGEAKPGDMWVNTSDANKVYILFGGSWSLFNQSEFDSVQDILDSITKTMTGGSTIWRQDTAPTSGMVNGDLWFNTTSGMNNQCKKYNGTSWVLFDFTTLLSYVETKSDSWKDSDQLYSWIKDSDAYKSALASKLDTSVYNTVITPMLNEIPGMKNTLDGWSVLESKVNTAASNDIDLYNRLEAYRVYLEYQPALPGQPNSDYLKIARLDPSTGIRSGFEIRITNDEIGFFLTRTDGSGNIIGTDKLAYANGLEFRMVNATVTKQINLIPTEAPLGAAGGQQYFQLLATTDGAFQGLWVTDT